MTKEKSDLPKQRTARALAAWGPYLSDEPGEQYDEVQPHGNGLGIRSADHSRSRVFSVGTKTAWRVFVIAISSRLPQWHRNDMTRS